MGLSSTTRTCIICGTGNTSEEVAPGVPGSPIVDTVGIGGAEVVRVGNDGIGALTPGPGRSEATIAAGIDCSVSDRFVSEPLGFARGMEGK